MPTFTTYRVHSLTANAIRLLKSWELHFKPQLYKTHTTLTSRKNIYFKNNISSITNIYISFYIALFSRYKWLVSRTTLRQHLPCGLVARIPGFHPGGPGSIPGMGKCLDCEAKKLVLNYCCEKTRHIESERSCTDVHVSIISTVI